MKMPMNFLRLGSVVAALLTLAVLPACEDTSVDTSDLDNYFANNPYVSDPRTGPGSDVSINPSSASVSVIGQELVFTASGGTTPYSWHVANESNGSIIGRGSQGDYKATLLANNNVIVYDVNGHAAIATITCGSASSLSLSPSSATIPNSAGHTVQFTVIGGQAPYTWNVSFPDVASITQDGLYTSKAGLTEGSINVVTVTDAAGNSASATVTHGIVLTISPSAATISAGGSVAFVAHGGDGTYTWTIANPSLISSSTPASGGTYIYIARATATNAQNTVLLQDGSGGAVSATVTHN